MRTRFIALFVGLVAAAVLVDAAQSGPAETKLEAARKKEVVDGDLNAAIKQYQSIADTYQKTDRAAAATALLRMAEAYKTLGNAQARGATYERIVREFPEQTDIVAAAWSRRAAAGQMTATGVVNRQVWMTSDANIDFWDGDVSPDGRYLSFVNWSTGDLAIRDLTAGTARLLTDNRESPFAKGYAHGSAFSPNGQLVAFNWTEGPDKAGCRIARVDGSQPTRVLFESADAKAVTPHDWSPDGRWIAVEIARRDATNQIALLSATDGTLKVLKSIDWRGVRKIAFSPDGKLLAYDLPDEDKAARDVWTIAVDGSSNERVVRHQASDLVIGWMPDGKLLFESDRSGAPALWALSFSNGKPAGAPTLVREGLRTDGTFGVTSSGSLRYAVSTGGTSLSIAAIDIATGKTIEAPSPVAEREPRPIAADWSPDGASMVVRLRDDSLWVRDVASGAMRQLNHPFVRLSQVNWLSADSIVLRAVDLKGRWGLHRLDVSSGRVTPIELAECHEERCPIDPETIKLIHSVSPDFQSIYYALEPAPGHQGDRVFIQHDVASGRDRELLRGRGLFGFRLSPRGEQLTFIRPDPATKGNALYVLSIPTGKSREVFRAAAGATLTNLVEWMADEQHLLVGQLQQGVDESGWIVPVAGGTPVKVELRLRDSNRDAYRSAHLHPDNHHVLLTSGPPPVAELWTLENFLPATTARK